MAETQKQGGLEPWQEDIVYEYYENNAKKLYQTVDRMLHKYGGITDHDEFYVLATDLFMLCIKKIDRDKGSFDGFFCSVLSRKIITAIRDKNRAIRSNTKQIVGEDGKVHYEFNPNISISTPIGDGDSTLEDIIEDDSIKEELSNNVENYLESLSKTQKKIADMVIKNYSLQEIKEELNISEVKFTKILSGMKSFDKEIILKHSDAIVEEDKPMENNVTFEKSKTNRLSISSLKKKITSQTIRFNHPLQRPSDQWTSAMKGNLVSDILQGNPINPLIFAEEVINGIPIIWDLDGKQRCTNAYDFLKDKFKVSKKVRRSNITYTSIIKNDKGKQILDENGFPQSEIKEFDIANKKFSQLPEELQEKFLDYNFEIVQYINCSKEDIAYHIARYNEGKPMSVNHRGIIRLGEEFATMVKSISVMPFFKEQGGYTVSEAKGTNGIINRVVVESIMAANYLNDWKKTQEEACEYLKENATTEIFDNFEDMVDRISTVGTEETLQMFDSKDSLLYFGLFARFCDTGVNDEKFIEFMAEFSQSLHKKEINGVTFDSLCMNKEGKSTSNKDKLVAIGKIDILEKLMLDYLNITNTEATRLEETSVLDFVRENVGQADILDTDVKHEDIELYEEMLSDLTVNVDNNTKLLEDKNKFSLLAIIAYSCVKDIYLDEWFVSFFESHATYILNQKNNFLHMKESLDKYAMNGGQLACAM